MSSLRNLLLAAVFVAGIALIAVVALTRYASPRIEQALSRWAERNGSESVEIRIRAFPIRAVMSGLRMEAGGERVTEVAEADCQMSLWRLLSRDHRIDHVTLRGAKLRVDITEEGTVILAGLTLGGREKKSMEGLPRRGQYGIDLLKISDSAIHVAAPNLQTTLHVSNLEFREGREIVAGEVSFQGLELKFIHNADDTWQLLSGEGAELAALGTGEKRESRFEGVGPS